MKQYYITKSITLKKPDPFRNIINFIILVIAVPVVAICIASIFFYLFFIWITSLFANNKTVNTSEEYYHSELELLNNTYVKVILVEDELDTELSHLNELWMDNVYNRETGLYRAKTTPVIKELEGRVLGFYICEQPGGAIFQVFNSTDSDDNPLHSQLVFLCYHNLTASLIDETGAYYLYNDEKNSNIILGFNKKEKIRMELLRS